MHEGFFYKIKHPSMVGVLERILKTIEYVKIIYA